MTKPKTQTYSPSSAASPLVGETVKWYKDGWHFGTLMKLGRKWASIRVGTITKRILVSEVLRYE